MQTIDLPNLADLAHDIPADGAARRRKFYRLVDDRALAESANALRDAAEQVRDHDGALATALTLGASIAANDASSDSSREKLRSIVGTPEFVALVPSLIAELRELASARPDTGACAVASALELWSWTARHFRARDRAQGEALPQVGEELGETFASLLAARCFALDAGAGASPQIRRDLAHISSARAAAAAGSSCAELVYGYMRHPRWDEAGCASCYDAEELEMLEGIIPGIASGVRGATDVIESDGSHAAKAGPCVRFDGLSDFARLRAKLDGCLTGVRVARDRAALAT